MAIGTDDELTEDSDPEIETVATLEKLLSDSGVGRVDIPVKKTRTKDVGGRGRGIQDLHTGRI